jgi:hypothetical protein
MRRLSGSSTRTLSFGVTLVALAAALAALVLALSMLASQAEAAGHAGGFERKQQLNVVQCPTGGSDFLCVGTGAGDALMGRDGTNDWIQGGEGDDTYDGKGGCDGLYDASLTSNDRYLVSVKDFCDVGISWLSIQDDGGNKDVLDLGRFYRSSDFALSKGYTNLYMDGPGNNDISIEGFFTTGSGSADSVDTFKFSDKTLSARKVKEMIV